MASKKLRGIDWWFIRTVELYFIGMKKVSSVKCVLGIIFGLASEGIRVFCYCFIYSCSSVSYIERLNSIFSNFLQFLSTKKDTEIESGFLTLPEMHSTSIMFCPINVETSKLGIFEAFLSMYLQFFLKSLSASAGSKRVNTGMMKLGSLRGNCSG